MTWKNLDVFSAGNYKMKIIRGKKTKQMNFIAKIAYTFSIVNDCPANNECLKRLTKIKKCGNINVGGRRGRNT